MKLSRSNSGHSITWAAKPEKEKRQKKTQTALAEYVLIKRSEAFFARIIPKVPPNTLAAISITPMSKKEIGTAITAATTV
jgi:hypothetical protein